MFFDKVYRAVGKKRKEITRYDLINENVEIDDMLLESLERSGRAYLKRQGDYICLYYTMKKEGEIEG